MRALKAFLVIMGLLIAAGFVYVGLEVYRRANDPDCRASVAARAESPATLALDLPDGARIGEMVAVANRLVFKVTLPEGEDRLYVLDPRDATIVGTVRPTAAPAP